MFQTATADNVFGLEHHCGFHFRRVCQHAAHARTSRYITDTTKERYHQCQNVNCSATFITYESVQRYIVKPGEVHAVRPHPLPSGQQIMWM
ncbi:DNA-binding transcriptional regulator [Escherichia coli]|nr:DNA-binding transcriptional regulator [Escherichia coli]EIT7713563.1 DNA-binding transcriptional regulator [Escherichia coli]EJA0981594.1 DNA-binding transcriptional regulator [Escherichia coli]EJD3860186.1 DNA-binding transcriptional regulator [Escherichia coli]EKG1472402.1 DNA-binding transcriptional regulator [Escherichia coli]